MIFLLSYVSRDMKGSRVKRTCCARPSRVFYIVFDHKILSLNTSVLHWIIFTYKIKQNLFNRETYAHFLEVKSCLMQNSLFTKMPYYFLFGYDCYKLGKVCYTPSNFKVTSNFSSSNGGKPPVAESLASLPKFELPPALVLWI